MAKLPRYNEKAETKKAESWQKKVDKLQTKIDKQQAKIDKEEEREMEAPDAGGYQTISAFIVFEEDEHYEDALRWENISKFQVRQSLRSADVECLRTYQSQSAPSAVSCCVRTHLLLRRALQVDGGFELKEDGEVRRVGGVRRIRGDDNATGTSIHIKPAEEPNTIL